MKIPKIEGTGKYINCHLFPQKSKSNKFTVINSSGGGILHEFAPSRDLKKALECPICSDVPLAPIYTCTSGHTTCGKCRSGFSCGVCNEDLSNTGRNSTVEMIVASSSFWCKYLVDGCQATVLGSEYRHHVNECEFR